MENIVGLDIGATKIACGLVSPAGQILSDVKIETEDERGFKTIITNAATAVENILSGEKGSKMGIGIAGQIDRDKGEVIHSPNMPALDGKPILKLLREQLDWKGHISIDNDANCFALAENKVGTGKGTKDMVGITLGTGVGSGVIIDGKLYHGLGGATELGHMKIEMGGLECSCARHGCLEAYASGWAMYKMYTEKTGKKIIPSDIVEEAKIDKDGAAMEV